MASRTVPVGTRFGLSLNTSSLNATAAFQCHPGGKTEAVVLFTLAILGMSANLLLMGLILTKKHLRRWSQGLLFHQGFVDCARAAILVPLGISVLRCQPLRRCSLLENTFVMLVTVSSINMLTTVLNDSPLIPDEEENPLPLLMDSPHCVLFGTGMIWFASLTINLGPTFLTGALAISQDLMDTCPLVYGPMRHYVLNILWIAINLLCILLTFFHLRKLYRDLTKSHLEADRAASLVTTAMVGVDGAVCENQRIRSHVHRFEREGVERVKMFLITTVAYVLFWCPLFVITVVDPTAKNLGLTYDITLHVAFVHAFVNPTLLIVLHKGLRSATLDTCCCFCCFEAVGDGSVRRKSRRSRRWTPDVGRFPDGELDSPCNHYACAVSRNYIVKNGFGELPPEVAIFDNSVLHNRL